MDQDPSRLENYEMLKALYDFNATFAKALTFQENDHFIFYHGQTKKKNWWQVVNSKGQVGYIPSNYITSIKVHPQFLINFLDDAIEFLKISDGKQNCSSVDKQELLQKLIEKKQLAELYKKNKKQAPQPPDFGSTTPDKEISDLNYEERLKSKSSESIHSSVQNEVIIIKGPLKEYKKKLQHRKTKSEVPKTEIIEINGQTPKKSPGKTGSIGLREINPRTAYKLLDQVRKTTQLSYEMSKVAVTVILNELQSIMPPETSYYFDSILSQLKHPLHASKMSIEETYDANRLRIILTELTSCKEDSQQRSWMLYEDEETIIEYIKELTSILTNADSNVSRHILRQNEYNGVTTLVQYYQMETRWSIRQLLLEAFGVMSSLDPIIVTIMLNSILPMELARDMKSHSRNVVRLKYSSYLLTMIFSMGEPMPVTHFEQLGPEFVTFLLDNIENPPDTDVDDQIPDLFVHLILSYNLQMHSENVVIDTLRKRIVAKTFTEKILLLLNREIDPVRIFNHEPAPPDSVLKLFNDLFESDETASLFYTNDVKVLIDIILRQLFDISPGERRRQYLELCRRILKTTNYNEHLHRVDDVLKCFLRIFSEESTESQGDQALVREISNEFPHLFNLT